MRLRRLPDLATRVWLARLWMCLLLGAGIPAWAAPALEDVCRTPILDLDPSAQVLEDPDGTLDIEQVAALAPERFVPLAQGLPSGFSHSAFWLRLPMHNNGAQPCMRWLTLGEPRLQSLQVYSREADAGWRVQRGGIHHPLSEWTAIERHPLFELELQPGEQRTVFARIASNSLLLIQPTLWSQVALLQEKQRLYMADGLSLGLTLILVPFSFVIGVLLRSRLLLAHAAAVASYTLMTFVISGYLIYWPSALDWSHEIHMLTLTLSVGLFLGSIRVLWRVRELPRLWGLLFSLALLLYVASHAYALWVDQAHGRALSLLVLQAIYPLGLSAFAYGVLRGIRHNWLAWLTAAGVLLQFMARHVLNLQQQPWQPETVLLNPSTTVPGALLLSCTLLLEVSASRQRAKRVNADMQAQRHGTQERLEDQVTRRTQQLRASLQARGKLMARISHDLRAPLVSIIDYAQGLRRTPEPDYAQKIERSARNQLELIDELLTSSRTELDELPLQIEVVPGDLREFLRDIEDEGRFLAARQGNSFDCRLPADLPAQVLADFRRLRQVLINLLSNAAKFTRAGHIGLLVERHHDGQPHLLRLSFSVTDTGIGIAAHERERLLQPFQRGRNARQFAGNGLGLAIVTQILQPMGSTLELESPLEGGSRLRFNLELACTSAPQPCR